MAPIHPIELVGGKNAFVIEVLLGQLLSHMISDGRAGVSC